MSGSELLRHTITVLFRRVHIAAALFVMVMAAAITMAMLAPKEYQSRMKFLLRNERVDLVLSPEATPAGAPGGVTEAQINSEVELLTSTDLMRTLVKEARLDSNEVSWDPDPDRRAVILMEKALVRLQAALKITPVKKSNVIVLEYTAPSPQLAASVLRKLAEVFLDAHLRMHRSPGTYEFFRVQKAAYEEQLAGEERRLAELRRQKDAPMLAEQKDAALQAYSQLTGQLYDAEASISQNERKIAGLNDRLRSVSPRIITQRRSATNQQEVQSLSTLLAQLENRRTELLTKLLPGDRFVIEVEQQIANTRTALNKAARMIETEQASDVNPLRQRLEEELARTELDLAGLRARRETLARQARERKARLDELADATLNHDNLTRRVRAAEENYLLYSKKQEEARIGDALDGRKIANVTVAESAAEPVLPARPKRSVYFSVGFLLASFTAVAGAFTIEHLSETIHTPAELEAATGLRVLATLPAQRS